MFEHIEDEAVRNQLIEEHNKALGAATDDLNKKLVAATGSTSDKVKLAVQEALDKAEADFQGKTKATQEQIDAAVAKALETETTGLKTKNAQLLDEKKKFQEQMEKFKDINDPAKALEALEFLTTSEEARMIKEGRFQEVIDAKTKKLVEDYEAKIADVGTNLDTTVADLNQKLELSQAGESLYKTQYEKKMVGDDFRKIAIAEGVRQEAVEEIVEKALGVFTLSDKDTPEARDKEGNLIKHSDTEILTPNLFVQGLKESHAYFWPESEGAGAQGSGGGSGSGSGKGGQSDTDKLLVLAKAGEMKKYRALRVAMEEKKAANA